MTKSFNKFKEPYFWPIFQNFLGIFFFFFSQNLPLSCTTSYGFLAAYQNLEKTKDTIPRKRLDRRMDRSTEGWIDPNL